MELDAFTNKVVLVKVKDNLEAVCKKQKTSKKQYLNVIKDTINTKAVFNKITK
jgi:hypothetical protein